MGQALLGLGVLPYEMRVLGPLALGLPPLVLAGFGSVLGLMLYLHAPRDALAQMTTVALEAGLPLAAGVAATAVTLQEPAIELHLTLPTPYRLTLLRRLALLLGWTALIEVAVTLALAASAPWALLKPGPVGVLMWLAPSLWLAAVGALLALLLRSWSAGGALLGGLWVTQPVLHGYFAATGWLRPWFLFATSYDATAPFWLTNRVEVIITALAVIVGLWAYLRAVEWRFTGEEG